MLKAEYAEAIVVVGKLSPQECGRELRTKYGTIISVFLIFICILLLFYIKVLI